MQTLGLDPAPPRSDGRIKSLLWPTVANDTDVDHVTTQGFWICFTIAVVTLVISVVSGQYAGILDSLFFYLGGNGVRQRSRIAAACVFIVYALDTVVLGRSAAYRSGGIIRVVFGALLLANVRAVWIASKWRSAGGADESPAPLSETLTDRLSDSGPRLVWPKARFVFYAFAFLEIAALAFVLLRA
jgi:hypothetical protein